MSTTSTTTVYIQYILSIYFSMDYLKTVPHLTLYASPYMERTGTRAGQAAVRRWDRGSKKRETRTPRRGRHTRRVLYLIIAVGPKGVQQYFVTRKKVQK